MHGLDWRMIERTHLGQALTGWRGSGCMRIQRSQRANTQYLPGWLIDGPQLRVRAIAPTVQWHTTKSESSRRRDSMARQT